MFEHLIVGELHTIQLVDSETEHQGCLRLLERVSYWKLCGAMWSQIRSFYASIIAGIENHKITWKTPFSEYEMYVIDRPPVSAVVKPDKSRKKEWKERDQVWFCKEYNSSEGCTLLPPHMVTDNNNREHS